VNCGYIGDNDKLMGYEEGDDGGGSLLIWGLLISLIMGISSVFFAQWRRQKYVLKFLTTFSLLIWLLINQISSGHFDLFPSLIIGAFVFSLAGDYQLSLKKEQGGFIRGVGLFFFAHLFYLAAFLQKGMVHLPVLLVTALLVFTYYFLFIFRNIKDNKLNAAVFVYMLISLFVFSTSAGTGIGVRPCFATGAFLILFSDAVIGWNAFYKPFKYNELIILSTYYSAQIMITAGVLSVQ